MRPDLSRLTRELRKETCPPGVLDAVGRRLQDRPPERRRFALAVACAVLGQLRGGLANGTRPIARGGRPLS